MADPLTVPVAGGMLRGLRWGPPAGQGLPVVVAAHGLTSSSRFWTLVGECLAREVTLLAPDLRGRGDSGRLPGPYGIASHAADLLAVLDAAGAARGVVAGHSMGGVVAAVAATRAPERVAGVVLVDGGPPFGPPLAPGDDVHAAIEAVVGPSLQRLGRRFASRDDYRAFWRAHPAFGDVPGWLTDAYADHDLAGEPPALRSKVSPAAVREDAADTLRDERVRGAAGRLTCPGVFLRAERGLLDQPEGLYGPDQTERLPNLDVRTVPGTNHYTIGLSPHGAEAVAAAIRSVLAANRP